MPHSPTLSSLPFVEVLEHGIHVIDTGFYRPLFDASYLIIESGRAAFIDTGTNHSVPRLLAALEAAGLSPDAVDWVIATHVHLDHAGGIGLLMTHLPNAVLVVHPHGAAHLIDPTRLVQGACAVYGAEEVARSYGDIIGVPAARVLRSTDGMTITLGATLRPLTLLDTPGHARHHHCIWDARSQGFFSGDTFGLSYREFDTTHGAWVMPTSSPVQFEPEPMRNSVQRMLAYEPTRLYVTHYGSIGASAADVRRIGDLLLTQLDAMVALGTSLTDEVVTDAVAQSLIQPPIDDAVRHAALLSGFAAIHLASLRAHGFTLPDAEIAALMQLDVVLNAQGMAIWLDRRQRTVAAPAPVSA